eukprot:TRINITY_DN8184_c0_g1_i3.p1 TRINITY_DN8184_c0_g1~~TRINITY_DN8184_c0_g1_i3.p1  ORF type:complete len:861 (-),score=240.88 TRINITY_DN8184_c0_g1_i3:55-2496(-)
MGANRGPQSEPEPEPQTATPETTEQVESTEDNNETTTEDQTPQTGFQVADTSHRRGHRATMANFEVGSFQLGGGRRSMMGANRGSPTSTEDAAEDKATPSTGDDVEDESTPSTGDTDSPVDAAAEGNETDPPANDGSRSPNSRKNRGSMNATNQTPFGQSTGNSRRNRGSLNATNQTPFGQSNPTFRGIKQARNRSKRGTANLSAQKDSVFIGAGRDVDGNTRYARKNKIIGGNRRRIRPSGGNFTPQRDSVLTFDDYLPESVKNTRRMCILGDENVGKSSLLNKYLNDTFTNEGCDETTAFDTKIFGTNVKILDTKGSPATSIATPNWIRFAEGFIFVYDVNSRESLQIVEGIIQLVRIMEGDDGRYPSILVANQIDNEEGRVITTEEGQNMAQLFDCNFLEVSAKEGTNVNQTFETLFDLIENKRQEAQQNLVRQSIYIGALSNFDIGIETNEPDTPQPTPEPENDQQESVPDEPEAETDTTTDIPESTEDRKKKIFNKLSKKRSFRGKTWHEPEKEGWLVKVGKVRKSSKKRWFRLKNDEVFYFTNPKQKTPQGSFSLEGANVEVPDNCNEARFLVVTPTRTWIITADTEDERNSWIESILRCINREVNFSVSLEFAVDRTISRGSKIPVPHLVQTCVNWLREEDSKEIVGIFRISGTSGGVQDLKEVFDTVPDEKVEIPDEEDIHNICSMLKLYFRELPNPLLTFQLYDRFIKSQDIEDDSARLEEVKTITHELPDYYYETLKFLVEYLSEISDNNHVNKMTTENLAVVFGPTLCKGENEDPRHLFTSMKMQYGIVKDLIFWYKEIFCE